MFSTMKNIIIAIAVALTLAIVIAVVVIVSSGSSDPSPDPNSSTTTTTTPVPTHGIFKRCDGRTEPIPKIKVSSCPDSTEAGYCKIYASKTTRVDLTFFPMEKFESAYLHMIGPNFYHCNNACNDNSLGCPLEPASKQQLVQVFYPETFNEGESGQMKFILTTAKIYGAGEVIICVEFPVEVD